MPSSSSSYTNHTIHSSAIAAAATSATTSLSNQRISSEAVCTPIGECEFCPPKWRVMIEKEEQTIKDEYESCIEYGRRIQFECTVLFQGKWCLGAGYLLWNRSVFALRLGIGDIVDCAFVGWGKGSRITTCWNMQMAVHFILFLNHYHDLPCNFSIQPTIRWKR